MLSDVNVFCTCFPLVSTLEGRVAEGTHFKNLFLSRVVHVKNTPMLNCRRTRRRVTSTANITIRVTTMLVRQCRMRRVVMIENIIAIAAIRIRCLLEV